MGLPSSKRPEARGVRGWFLSATPLLILGLAVFVVALNVRKRTLQSQKLLFSPLAKLLLFPFGILQHSGRKLLYFDFPKDSTFTAPMASSDPLARAIVIAICDTPNLHADDALNRHYSTMCGSESARDEILNKAAMERRIRTLEQEIAQNGVLLKKVLDGLESRFNISSLFSVQELQRLAQMEAADIAQRRARQPPPPMSEYAKAKVSAAVDVGTMQDLVEGAVSPIQRSSFQDLAPAEGGNEGWEWGSQSASVYEDDFLGINKVESIKPPKFDVSDKERESLCRGWMAEHKVLPGVDWGTLRDEDQRKWKEYHCDEVVDPAAVNEVVTIFGDPLPDDDGGVIEGGEGEWEGQEEGEGGEENERQPGPRRPNDDFANSDNEVASVPEDRLRER